MSLNESAQELLQNVPNLPGKMRISLCQIELLRNGRNHSIELVEFYLDSVKAWLESTEEILA